MVDQEIEKFLHKNIIEQVGDVEGQVVSNVFLRPKKDGGHRMILDLTWVNTHVQYEHFKMHSLQTALTMMREDCWMGSIDLKDAYYSVPVRKEDRKFLRFRWKGTLFQFRVLPNGLACAPRFFTKILNPVFAKLRESGVEGFPYIDDSFIVADSSEKCEKSVRQLKETLESLGFVVHQGKSVFKPTRQLVFLGFELDSEEFKVSLTRDKEDKLLRAAQDLLSKETPTIREVAGLIGLMIAFVQAFSYAESYTKALERDKIEALREQRGNFSARMRLSQESIQDIGWWTENVRRSGRPVKRDQPQMVVFTDASNEGWGAHVGSRETGGRWSESEKLEHINALELKAIQFGLAALCEVEDTHIRVMTDSTTAMAYVKHQGGVKSEPCNQVAQEIWKWSELRGNWISIAHVPGVENTIADFKSRNFEDNLEWSLNDKLFDRVVDCFGEPDIDLFATRLNCKVTRYVSWKPDPSAYAIDAFSISWSEFKFYAFPPFSCVGRALKKAVAERATGVLIVPWLAEPTLVGQTHQPGIATPQVQAEEEKSQRVGQPRQRSTTRQMPIGGIPILGKSLLREGFDRKTVDLMMKAWRPSTKTLYSTYIKKWLLFCYERGIKPQAASIPQACRFLRLLLEQGMGYAAVNAARCALSLILPYQNGQSFGSNHVVCWLLRGCYEANPPKPRYENFWDVNLVFSLIKKWGHNRSLSLKQLSLKLTILLLLVSSQRGQTIINLTTDNMILEEDKVVFKLKTLKHNRVGDRLDTLVLKEFTLCRRLCVVRTVKTYLKATELVRGHSQLLLSFVRPHLPISRDTLARWTVLIMRLAGVNVDTYKGHSTRGASTSAARRLGVPLNVILKRASWRSEESFARYYNKDLDSDEGAVGQALLEDAV